LKVSEVKLNYHSQIVLRQIVRDKGVRGRGRVKSMAGP